MDLIMNMRTCNQPYGNDGATLVDKMIGTAYEVVRYVASNMEKLLYVADNMEAIHIAATGQAVPKPMEIVSFVGSSYGLIAREADRYKHVRLTNTGTINCTDTTDALVIGSWYEFKNTGTTSVLLTGATFNVPQSATPVIRPQGEARLLKVGTNSWDVIGDLVTA